jgi:cell wall-associated NlpC family hydrolase
MTYQPEIGDFGIIKSNGIAARLIQIGTVSRWNHAFIYIGDGKIIEAMPSKGITISEITKYNKIAWNQHQDLTDKQRNVIVKKAESLVGTIYGFLDIFLLGLRILGLKFLGGKFLEKLAMRQGIICSELVAICYDSAGVELVNKPEYLVTPGDLAEYLIYQ